MSKNQVRPDAATGTTTAKQERYEKKMAKYAANKVRKEQMKNEIRDAATVKIPMMNLGTINVGGAECEASAIKVTSVGEILIAATDVSINFAKKGKVPYSYSNLHLDGVRYGVSVSLHYINESLNAAVILYSDVEINKEFHQACAECVSSYLLKRGLKNNKPFREKVKTYGVTTENAYQSTIYLYHNTAA